MTLADQVRADFPILQQQVNEHQLIYFDSAASSQKPLAVLDSWRDYYQSDHANVHRGAHTLSARATEAYEAARDKIAKFINAKSSQEIVYTRNASEAINLVAYSWGMSNLKPGDEVILSVMEHHSNIVPWQLVAEKTGSVIKFIQLNSEQELDLENYQSLLSDRTKLVSIVHVSNTLGNLNPVEKMTHLAHNQGARVLLDACQSVPHLPIDVQALDCDWLVASGHKMCAPTGIGFLYGKLDLLRSMPPWMGGGEMIADVYFDHSTYADSPHRFEAGTPAIGEAIALGAAIDYLQAIGMDKIHDYEQELGAILIAELAKIPEVTIYGAYGANQPRAALAAFTVSGGIHANDVAALLDQSGIAIRSGHHCTQPLHRLLGLAGTARASLYFYNTPEEIEIFIQELKSTIDFFQSVLTS